MRAIQYRDKTADAAQRLDRASQLVAMTRVAGALLIVNDDVEIAARSGADGVHLGRDDADLANARRRLPHQMLGVSCYNEFDRARSAIDGGADAIAFGSMYPSVTKPAAVRATALTAVGCARRVAATAHHCDRRHQYRERRDRRCGRC